MVKNSFIHADHLIDNFSDKNVIIIRNSKDNINLNDNHKQNEQIVYIYNIIATVAKTVHLAVSKNDDLSENIDIATIYTNDVKHNNYDCCIIYTGWMPWFSFRSQTDIMADEKTHSGMWEIIGYQDFYKPKVTQQQIDNINLMSKFPLAYYYIDTASYRPIPTQDIIKIINKHPKVDANGFESQEKKILLSINDCFEGNPNDFIALNQELSHYTLTTDLYDYLDLDVVRIPHEYFLVTVTKKYIKNGQFYNNYDHKEFHFANIINRNSSKYQNKQLKKLHKKVMRHGWSINEISFLKQTDYHHELSKTKFSFEVGNKEQNKMQTQRSLVDKIAANVLPFCHINHHDQRVIRLDQNFLINKKSNIIELANYTAYYKDYNYHNNKMQLLNLKKKWDAILRKL